MSCSSALNTLLSSSFQRLSEVAGSCAGWVQYCEALQKLDALFLVTERQLLLVMGGFEHTMKHKPSCKKTSPLDEFAKLERCLCKI